MSKTNSINEIKFINYTTAWRSTSKFLNVRETKNVVKVVWRKSYDNIPEVLDLFLQNLPDLRIHTWIILFT